MNNPKIVKTSNIDIEIGLNENKHPDSIRWKSTDNPNGTGYTDAKAMLLSIFDKEYKDTLKIDLWTTDMEVVEMDRFFFQSLRAMADTYYRATQNTQLANDMQLFVDYFGKQTGIIPNDHQSE
jgi:gliding motility-associated protein GldC